MGPGSLPATQCPVGGLLFLIGCFWDNGHLYRADQPSPAPGHRCLNWLDAQSGLAFAPESGECPSQAAGGQAGGRRPCPNPGPCCLLSPLRRRQPQLLPEPGPGPARALVLRQPRGWSSREATLRGPALPRYPPRTPGPGLPRSCCCTRRARAAARRRPAPPRPAPSDWPGLSPGRGTRSSLAGAAARNELIPLKRLVNNRGRLGPAPRPSSVPGTPLGEPGRSASLVHALSSPLGVCVVSAVC